MVGVEELPGLITRLEKVALRLETVTKAQTFLDSEDAAPKSLKAYDEILEGAFKVFLEKSAAIGSLVKDMGDHTLQAFREQRRFIQFALQSEKPDQSSLQEQLQPTAKIINDIQAFREQNRRSDFFNHLSAISESIAVLGWVTVEPAPGPFTQEMSNAGQFYTNRVLKDWKEKSKVHVEWVKAWIETLAELQAYIREYHTTGLTWNVQSKGVSKPAAPVKKPPPPATNSAVNSSAAHAVNSQPAPKPEPQAPTPERPIRKKEEPVEKPKKEPVVELNGKKWMVEYVENKPDLIINVEEVSHCVYIYKCSGSTIQIKGKCTNIVMDGCTKTGLLFESAVASCEFINCKSVQMQVTGAVPTISIDKTDGCQVFLSTDALGVQLITSKSSEMNLMLPTGDEFVEVPVPEQFRTTIQPSNKIQTVPVEHTIDII